MLSKCPDGALAKGTIVKRAAMIQNAYMHAYVQMQKTLKESICLKAACKIAKCKTANKIKGSDSSSSKGSNGGSWVIFRNRNSIFKSVTTS